MRLAASGGLRLTLIGILTLVSLIIATPPGTAQAATHAVPCLPSLDEREALLKLTVNSAETNDVIELEAGCVYTLTTPADTSADRGATGLPRIKDKELTIKGNGAVIERSSADGTPKFRLLALDWVPYIPGTKVRLENLTLRNGDLSDTPYSGGAIDNETSTLELVNVTLENNWAKHGGAIYQESGTLSISNSTFRDNHAIDSGQLGSGGAIDAEYANVTISGSTFEHNTAPNKGGAINFLGDEDDDERLTLTTSIVRENSAYEGGGIYSNGPLTIARSLIHSNVATGGSGGGINHVSEYDPLTITNTTITENTANGGSGSGGGFRTDGPATLIHTTVVSNAGTISGIDVNADWGGSLTLRNSIVADTACTSTEGITDAGYNLATDDSCNIGSGPGSQIVTDPVLGTLRDNGGPTFTMLPLVGSPAIDAIPAADCSDITTDQRGVARPQQGLCDIGAVEADDFTPPTVTITAPVDGARYPIGAQVQVSYHCDDSESGIANCSGTVPADAPLDTSAAGSFSFTVTATDHAGHVTTETVTFTVYEPSTLTTRLALPGLTVRQGMPILLITTFTGEQGQNLSSATRPLKPVALVHLDSDTVKQPRGLTLPFRYHRALAPRGGGYFGLILTHKLAPGDWVLQATVGDDPTLYEIPFTVR